MEEITDFNMNDQKNMTGCMCAQGHCACGSAPITVGASVPDLEFEVYHKKDFKKMHFSEFQGKWLVVMFYPGDFTFVCPTELEDMAKLYPEFEKRGAEVLSFSTDTVFVHKAWHDSSKAVKNVSYPMGADPSGKISKAFGVLIADGGAVCSPDEGMARRGTFLIDPKGTVRTMEIHDNSVGRKAAETLRKLEAALYVEAHPGNVCPASWEEGDDTLAPGVDLVGKI